MVNVFAGFEIHTASDTDIADAMEHGESVFAEDSGVSFQAFKHNGNIYIVGMMEEKP